jgi:hypothetical protein
MPARFDSSPKTAASPHHLIEHSAECKNVAAGVRFFSLDLLRRHVLNRADDAARRGERSQWTRPAQRGRRSKRRRRCSRSRRCRLRALRLSPDQSPSASRRPAVSMMFPGFRSRCTMPLRCATASASATAIPTLKTSFSGIAPLRNFPPEFHLPETPSPDNRCHSASRCRRAGRCGMVQRRNGSRLALHALLQFGRRRKMRSQNLHRHDTVEARIFRARKLLPCRPRPAETEFRTGPSFVPEVRAIVRAIIAWRLLVESRALRRQNDAVQLVRGRWPVRHRSGLSDRSS